MTARPHPHPPIGKTNDAVRAELGGAGLFFIIPTRHAVEETEKTDGRVI